MISGARQVYIVHMFSWFTYRSLMVGFKATCTWNVLTGGLTTVSTSRFNAHNKTPPKITVSTELINSTIVTYIVLRKYSPYVIAGSFSSWTIKICRRIIEEWNTHGMRIWVNTMSNCIKYIVSCPRQCISNSYNETIWDVRNGDNTIIY